MELAKKDQANYMENTSSLFFLHQCLYSFYIMCLMIVLIYSLLLRLNPPVLIFLYIFLTIKTLVLWFLLEAAFETSNEAWKLQISKHGYHL